MTLLIYDILIATLLLIIVGMAVAFIRHQRLLITRAHLMREAMRNRDFTFSLPTKGLLPGERALQRALNDLGEEIGKLVAQNEVESWQRLTRVLTHEIMNATTPIQSISEAYLHSPKLIGTPYEEGIRAIYETSSGLARFVASYRTLTQMQEPVITTLNLAETVEHIQSLYPALEWQIEVPAETTLEADETLLRQVLINLIKNATEAGATKIGIKWDNALYIGNNGQPISAEVRREIFIPFFTTKRSGSGIGLSLSRQLLMLQGMDITLADQGQAGYHVTFCLKRR